MNSKVYTIYIVGKDKKRFSELLENFDNVKERIKSDSRDSFIHKVVVELNDDEAMLIKLTLETGNYIMEEYIERKPYVVPYKHNRIP